MIQRGRRSGRAGSVPESARSDAKNRDVYAWELVGSESEAKQRVKIRTVEYRGDEHGHDAICEGEPRAVHPSVVERHGVPIGRVSLPETEGSVSRSAWLAPRCVHISHPLAGEMQRAIRTVCMAMRRCGLCRNQRLAVATKTHITTKGAAHAEMQHTSCCAGRPVRAREHMRPEDTE